MKFAVDRIEDRIAVLENLSTKEKREVSLKRLPNAIKDGTIIIYDNHKYVKDVEEERLERIQNKFNNLKKDNKKY